MPFPTGFGCRAAAFLLLLTCAAAGAFAQANPCRTALAVSTLGSPPVPQAPIVYDPNQSVCWPANTDLAGDPAMQTALDRLDRVRLSKMTLG